MPVVDTVTDRHTLAVTIVVDVPGAPAELFEVYTDPRRLERVWGPPTHPATFVEHRLAPGWRSTYYLSGGWGELYPGWWQVLTVEAPHRFTFDDGFADGGFNALPGTPVAHNEYTFRQVGSRTRLTCRSTYASAEDFDAALGMGVVESAVAAAEQLEPLLREERAAARERRLARV